MDLTVSVVKLTAKLYVLVYQVIKEFHQNVDLSVLLVQNVLKTGHVLIKNVPILVQVFAVCMQIAK